MVKVYDKEIYEKQESIKFTFLIIIVFLLGFFAGYIANSFTHKKETPQNNTVVVENIKSQNNT